MAARSHRMVRSAVDVGIIAIVGKVWTLLDGWDRGGHGDGDFAACHVCGNIKGH